MRERIGELHAQLGIRFPIYVMVTKCDLLAGFAEFFADFDKDERAQVWGATLVARRPPQPSPGGRGRKQPPATRRPTDADTAARLARLTGEMVALEKSLHECLIARLHDERDRERRAALFGFPQQWRVLRDSLTEMMRMTFESSAGGAAPLLRGVYFTSATQEGSPMDRALGALSRALGLAHRVLPPGRPERPLVLRDPLAARGRARRGRTGRHQSPLGAPARVAARRRGRRQRDCHGCGAGLGVASIQPQRRTAGRGGDPRSRVCKLRRRRPRPRRQAADLSTMVPLLDGLWSLARDGDGRGSRHAPAWAWTRAATSAAAAQDAYHHVLRDSLVPRLAKRLEQRLDASERRRAVRRYEALKAYLMLFGGTHFDATALRSYLLADWDQNAAQVGSAAARKALREHLDRLLATGEVGAPAMADAAWSRARASN